MNSPHRAFNRLKAAYSWGKIDWRPRHSRVPTIPHEQLGRMLQPLGIDELIAMEIPEKKALLSPILPESGLMMIHARRGGAKTFLALSIGLAVASGTSLMRWSAPKPRRVLYVDGEMIWIGARRGDRHATAHAETHRADLAPRNVPAGIEVGEKDLSVLSRLVVASGSHQRAEVRPHVTLEHLFGHERLVRAEAIEEVGQQHDIAGVGKALCISSTAGRISPASM